MPRSPLYKLKTERFDTSDFLKNSTKIMVVTSIDNGRIFYHPLSDETQKLTSSIPSFNQKYEHIGFQD